MNPLDHLKKKMRPKHGLLWAIAASASVSIWSGWVGVGERTGFGVVHPLPGILDKVEINTAITLPIGLEAYAAYSIGAALSKDASRATRTYAAVSGATALVLGMGGQVAYHLMAANGIRQAPTWVTTIVSCLPVLVLGLAAVLAHLKVRDRHNGSGEGSASQERATESATAEPANEPPVAGSAAGSGDGSPDGTPVAHADVVRATETTAAEPSREPASEPEREPAIGGSRDGSPQGSLSGSQNGAKPGSGRGSAGRHKRGRRKPTPQALRTARAECRELLEAGVRPTDRHWLPKVGRSAAKTIIDETRAELAAERAAERDAG